MKKGFLTNKYTLSVFILLAILAVDVILHKGMSRVMLPETFTDQRQASNLKPGCSATLVSSQKKWAKAINSVSMANSVDSSYGGVELDVYFDTSQHCFFVYHDSTQISNTTAEEILATLEKRNIGFSTWLDFKNLDASNEKEALERLIDLRKRFSLQKKILVESSNIQSLSSFCNNDFYTSYYIPFFNPYKDDETALLHDIDSISSSLKNSPVSALSGYYFQADFLRKYFPNFPILTWADDPSISLIANVFNRKLLADEQIKIVLYPTGN